jgi:hypothetical protein
VTDGLLSGRQLAGMLQVFGPQASIFKSTSVYIYINCVYIHKLKIWLGFCSESDTYLGSMPI